MAVQPSQLSPSENIVVDPTPSAHSSPRDKKPQQIKDPISEDAPQHLEANPGYITTRQGTLTALETVGAAWLMVLYLLMGSSITWYAHAAFLLAFTYCLNNTLIIISAMASPSTQRNLPLTLFYSLYHCAAGLLFLMGAAVFYSFRSDDLPYKGFMGVTLFGVGTLHVCHGLSNLAM
ncbi:uncharacterized protein LOC144107934 [Amblyomma americanum]